jgi:IS1 family transposase
LILQCDEIWSFVGSKKKKVWIWIAIDRDSRTIAGAYAGSRDKEGALGLWNSLPVSCRKNAVFHSDFWPAYKEVFPFGRHFSFGKESGKTSHIERFNLTLRQRVSRLARKTILFSKNMIGALWNFIHHYNENIAPNLATTS